jgi:hypothetical protein
MPVSGIRIISTCLFLEHLQYGEAITAWVRYDQAGGTSRARALFTFGQSASSFTIAPAGRRVGELTGVFPGSVARADRFLASGGKPESSRAVFHFIGGRPALERPRGESELACGGIIGVAPSVGPDPVGFIAVQAQGSEHTRLRDHYHGPPGRARGAWLSVNLVRESHAVVIPSMWGAGRGAAGKTYRGNQHDQFR